MSGQVDINGDPLPRHIIRNDHLTPVKPPCPSEERATLERKEAWCIDCAHRVTVGSNEYGHDKDCEHHEFFDVDQIEAEETIDEAQAQLPGVGGDDDV